MDTSRLEIATIKRVTIGSRVRFIESIYDEADGWVVRVNAVEDFVTVNWDDGKRTDENVEDLYLLSRCREVA